MLNYIHEFHYINRRGLHVYPHSLSDNLSLHYIMLFLAVVSICIAVSTASAPTDVGVCGSEESSFTPEQQNKVVDLHNVLRSGEASANMIKMKWSTALEKRSLQLANQCVFEHGILTSCSGTRVGQNLYTDYSSQSIPPMNITSGVMDWFNEKKFYHYDTKTCDPGEQCGHYTQVVWDITSEVGCAWVQCPDGLLNDGHIIENANYFVCDYAPAGNVQGQSIYDKGEPCSGCAQQMDAYRCENNLCAPCSPATQPDCTCVPKECQNGGVFDEQQCRCNCPTEFYGKECEKSCLCQDTSGGCTTPEWRALCGNPLYREFLKETCPKTCGLCETPPDSCKKHE